MAILDPEGLPNLQKYIDRIKKIQLDSAFAVQNLTKAFHAEKERQKALKVNREKESEKLNKVKAKVK